MKFGITALIIWIAFGGVQAQKITPTVLASAGNVAKSGAFSLEWTLGEWMTETLRGSNLILTQGFHQTKLTIVSTRNEGLEGLDVYPNPFADRLTIRNQTGVNLHLQLMTVTGQRVSDYRIPVGSQELELESLPAGTYILEARSGAKSQNITLEKIN